MPAQPFLRAHRSTKTTKAPPCESDRRFSSDSGRCASTRERNKFGDSIRTACMYRYLEMIQHIIDARPSRVPLAEIYEPSKEKRKIAAPIPQLSNKILAIRTR